LKQHKLWFDEEHLKLLDQGKQPKLHGLQDSSQTNGNNLKHIRRETNELEINSKNKNIRD
jgi:hypothetical protein